MKPRRGMFIIYAKLNKSFHKTKIWAKELSNFLELSEYEALHLASKTPSPSHLIQVLYMTKNVLFYVLPPHFTLQKVKFA
jgi:hypothetical protein